MSQLMSMEFQENRSENMTAQQRKLHARLSKKAAQDENKVLGVHVQGKTAGERKALMELRMEQAVQKKANLMKARQEKAHIVLERARIMGEKILAAERAAAEKEAAGLSA